MGFDFKKCTVSSVVFARVIGAKAIVTVALGASISIVASITVAIVAAGLLVAVAIATLVVAIAVAAGAVVAVSVTMAIIA